jgi:hypothetical protein
MIFDNASQLAASVLPYSTQEVQMRRRFIVGCALAIVALGALAPRAAAQNVHRDHLFTFNSPVLLPGGVTLPAGRYLFTFPSASTGQSVTQVLSPDRVTVFATLMTVPVERKEDGGFEVILVNTSPNGPPLLKAWFCDRGRTGHEFAYPLPR